MRRRDFEQVPISRRLRLVHTFVSGNAPFFRQYADLVTGLALALPLVHRLGITHLRRAASLLHVALSRLLLTIHLV
jgi:hypothetical protein